MSATLMNIISERTLRTAIEAFGEHLVSQMTDRGVQCDMDGFKLALEACMAELPTKPVKAKAKKGPSKTALATAEKRAALIDELSELGGVIDAEASQHNWPRRIGKFMHIKAISNAYIWHTISCCQKGDIGAATVSL